MLVSHYSSTKWNLASAEFIHVFKLYFLPDLSVALDTINHFSLGFHNYTLPLFLFFFSSLPDSLVSNSCNNSALQWTLLSLFLFLSVIMHFHSSTHQNREVWPSNRHLGLYLSQAIPTYCYSRIQIPLDLFF